MDFFVRNLLGEPTPDWNRQVAHPSLRTLCNENSMI
jgi:hypothetical protein